MSGSICTYTVYVREKPEDGGRERPVPCGKPRVDQLVGPAILLGLCKRHYEVVAKAIADKGDQYQLTLDQPAAEMAAAGGDE